jgi:hypothetical protein
MLVKFPEESRARGDSVYRHRSRSIFRVRKTRYFAAHNVCRSLGRANIGRFDLLAVVLHAVE